MCYCNRRRILRNHMPTLGRLCRDSIILSILKDEWFDTMLSNNYGSFTLNNKNAY
jgi:hypothetical protein